jgi:hypothetical protein
VDRRVWTNELLAVAVAAQAVAELLADVADGLARLAEHLAEAL